VAGDRHDLAAFLKFITPPTILLKRDLPDKESGYETDSGSTKHNEQPLLFAGDLGELSGLETSDARFSRS
jgi:hypothetical protein